MSSAIAKTTGAFRPWAAQDLEGTANVSLGAKGGVELEFVASGEMWGRRPSKNVHSVNRAWLESPADGRGDGQEGLRGDLQGGRRGVP